jgi:ribokinase
MALQVLSIGDVVTDAFVKLFDDRAHVFENEQGKWLAMPFGTKIPFDRSEIIKGVGNAANASVCFARLGIHSGLISNVGSDEFGRDIIDALEKERVDTRFVRIHHDKVTNYHYVLWYKEERTILINHEEYNYQWPRFTPTDVPEWVYFSSISKNALDKYHDMVIDWLDANPSVKLAFNPGTFQLEAGADSLKRVYERTEVVILNREEAVHVTGGDYNNIHDLIDRFHNLGPKVVVITDGPSGAYASDGQVRLKMPPYPDPKPPYERTGAGDAFASTLVAALIKGNTIEGALQWAPINSMNVVQNVGAQKGLLTEEKLEEYLQNAPEWYRPEQF